MRVRFYQPTGPESRLRLFSYECAGKCDRQPCLGSERGYGEYCCKPCHDSEGKEHNEHCTGNFEAIALFDDLFAGDEIYVQAVRCGRAVVVGPIDGGWLVRVLRFDGEDVDYGGTVFLASNGLLMMMNR